MASKRSTEQLPVIAHFEVRHRNYLAPDGSISRPFPAVATDAKLLVGLYRAMVLLRGLLTERLLHCSALVGSGPMPFRSARRRSRSGSPVRCEKKTYCYPPIATMAR